MREGCYGELCCHQHTSHWVAEARGNAFQRLRVTLCSISPNQVPGASQLFLKQAVLKGRFVSCWNFLIAKIVDFEVKPPFTLCYYNVSANKK